MLNHQFNPLFSPIINNQTILDRFNLVVNEITQQLCDRELDIIIGKIKLVVNNESELEDIIDGLINNCNCIKDNKIYKCFDQYADILLAPFTLNEKFCILGHLNLSALDYQVAEISSLFHYALYNIIKQKLTVL